MTRFVNSLSQAAADSPFVPFRLLAEIEVTSSTLYLHSGAGILQTNGHDYLGIGQYGAVSPIEEDIDVFPRPLKMSLNGVSSQYLYEAFTELLFNKPVILRRAFLTPGAGTLVASAELFYKGFIDKVDVYFSDPERGNYIELTCESRLRRESPAAYMTNEDQNLRHPTDTFFSLLGQIEGFRSNWGQQVLRGWVGGGGGGGRTINTPRQRV